MVLYITENQKRSSKQNLTNKEYHVHYNKDVEHQDVRIYCAINQFPRLKFIGRHNKPHGIHGLGKHHHMSFDPNIGYVTYPIRRILCDCTLCNYIIDKPWIPGFLARQQPCY